MQDGAIEAERHTVRDEARTEMIDCPECHTRHIWTRKGLSWGLFCGCAAEITGVEAARYNGEYDNKQEPETERQRYRPYSGKKL